MLPLTERSALEAFVTDSGPSISVEGEHLTKLWQSLLSKMGQSRICSASSCENPTEHEKVNRQMRFQLNWFCLFVCFCFVIPL